ncbi:MAG: hypothetical protein JNK94_01340 [Hyphomonadaceae bacterium]|nr:hypothetical protein [Hyphomonadaceae bacterium]MBX3510488.1 hypothetical protein [Hyphomonadaceae bacterium]
MRGQVFIAASVLAMTMAVSAPASAQQYPSYHDEHVARQEQCQQSRQNRSIGGAVIGGIAGALLGREVADRGVRGEGAALGAVVGAVAGAGVGRATANCATTPQGSYDPMYGGAQRTPYAGGGQAPYYGANDGYYRGDDSGLYGGPNDGYRQSTYRGQRGEECRMGEVISRDRRGREVREQVPMCRGRDGQWRPQY